MDKIDHIISNTFGVIIAEFCTLPICTLKTIYQTQHNNNNIITTAKLLYKTKGIQGYYNATWSGLSAQTISTVSKYGFYQYIKEKRKTKNNDIFNNAINRCLGGILGSLISHPFDVLKNYHQLHNNNYIKDVKKYPFTVYKGYSQTIIKNIFLYSSMYPIYDFYKTKISDKPYVIAPLTTLTMTLYLQPIDYIKTNIIAGNKILYNNLYKGFSLHLSRSIPHFMITMTITEYMKKNLKN